MNYFFRLKSFLGKLRQTLIITIFIPFIIISFLFNSGTPGAQENYQIGPQDELKIEVWDNPDLTRVVDVNLTGFFTFPLIGEVKAAGYTTEEIQEVLTKKLSNGYIKNPQITITITAYRSKQTNILGEVKNPGTYPFTRHTTLIEIISMAGGLTNEAGSEAYIIRYKDTNVVTSTNDVSASFHRRQHGANSTAGMEKINLDNLLRSGQNIYFMLKENDTIYVPRADFYYVIGEVNNPGHYKIEKDTTVLKALSRAGGYTDKANLKKISVIRMANGREKRFIASLSDTVMPNDIIKIPESFF